MLWPQLVDGLTRRESLRRPSIAAALSLWTGHVHVVRPSNVHALANALSSNAAGDATLAKLGDVKPKFPWLSEQRGGADAIVPVVLSINLRSLVYVSNV